MAMEFEGYSYGRALGRKRVVVSNNGESSSSVESRPTMAPLKRMCSGNFNSNSEKSRLETLPQDLLIRVLCGVDHEDLKQLIQVSKTIREAAEIAKQMHFEFSTPKKNTIAFRDPMEIGDGSAFQEIEAPNAPLRKSRARLSGRNLAGISVALFASDE